MRATVIGESSSASPPPELLLADPHAATAPMARISAADRTCFFMRSPWFTSVCSESRLLC
jgi:hypothetical protein